MKVLITMGGMRAPIDDVRFMANESTGAVGLALLDEFAQKDIACDVFCGWTATSVHLQRIDLRHRILYTPTFDEMKEALSLVSVPYDVAIFAAAVLDFIPEFSPGKMTSQQESVTL